MDSNEEFREKVFAIIRENFPHFRGELSDSTLASQVAGWDSFAHMQLMMTFEEELGIEFDSAKTFTLKNIGELVAFLERSRS